MSFDKRFYGIYQGICISSDDPEGKGRIMMQVPQVLGEAVTTWAPEVGGGIGQKDYLYGTFASTVDQLVDGAHVATVVDYSTTEDSNGISLEDGTKIVVSETGDYFIQFSVLFTKPTSSSSTVDFWIRKNGEDVPRSGTRAVVQGNPSDTVMTVSLIMDLDPNDYIEMVMASDNPDMKITTYTGLTAPIRPDIPGIITTINLVGKFKPKPGAVVWASFLGGDPNFPLWIGAS